MANSANTYLNVTELDFDQIRNNLKIHLSSQEQFKDYNFEGSAMSVLLDVLAYNTHYNAYYTNMLANEMFLDTAQQRDSVVSHAKLLGYTPVSSIGAQANVTVQFTGVDADNVRTFTIPKNSTFTTVIDDVTYTYVTPEAYTVTNDNGIFTRDVIIKEGEPLTHKFTVQNLSDRFILPNKNVDMTSIVVNVQESASDTTKKEYVKATNISQVYSTSEVYFLEEADNQKYEIVFGSGSLGKSLKVGNIVTVDYLVNNGDATNGSDTFSISNISTGLSGVQSSVSAVNVAASGGRNAESIKSIKFNAPKSYQTQNRCVVDKDYERVILAENPDIQSVVAFGGEEANPPAYGKVYIAIKPYGESYITATRKSQLKESILDRTPLSIDPVFVDGVYTYIIPEVTTYYSKNKTKISDAQIKQEILTKLEKYSTDNLERFGKKLRYSRLVRELDNVSVASIFNNDVKLKIQSRVVPNINEAEKLEINFNNAVNPYTLESTEFTFNGFECFIDDDGKGNLRIYRYTDTRERTTVSNNIGTIDYTSGEIVINTFAPTAYVGTFFKVTCQPTNLDINPTREQILILDPQDSVVTLVGEVE